VETKSALGGLPMKHFHALICWVALLIAICSCNKKSTPGNHAEDEQEVRQLEIEASKAITAKDLDKLVSLYADDAALYDERNPTIRGKDAVRAAWKADFARPGLTMSTEPRMVEISSGGDLAWAHGIYAMVTNDSAGKPVTDKFEYAMVYTKQLDGKWRIMADNANSALRSHLSRRPPEGRSLLGAFAPLIGLACFFCGLWFLLGMPVVVLLSAWRFYRSGKLSTGFLASVAMLIAFFLTAVFLWRYFAAHEWNLSLVNALRAAGDTARYGNPVEDTAEDMLVALLVLSTLSAAAAGGIMCVARRVWVRFRRSAL
jgi:uncharacterized protein (TIGR02246 family)